MSLTTTLRCGALAVALAMVLGPGDSKAQQETFGESIDVELVEIVLYVEEKNGDPVPDLRREELRIEVEGEPVDVSHFVVHRQTRGETDEGATISRIDEPEPALPTSVQAPEPVRYVAYVDDLNLRPHSRRRVLNELRDFFDESLKEGDEVMVASSSPRLRIHEAFTTDRRTVDAALEHLDRGRAAGTFEDQERSSLMQEVAYRYMDAHAAEAAQDRLEGSFRVQEEVERARAIRSLGILEDLIGSIAALPGRKVLLHVSDGLAMAPSEDVLSRLAGRAAAGRVVLVPIDGGGAARLDPRSGAASGAVGSFWSPETAQLRQDDRQLTLLSLAEETGGEMLLLKQMGRLPEMRDDLDVYYTVAFAPPPGPVGKDRDLRIEVDRKGVRVRHPRSFRIQSADERLRERLRAALAAPGGAPNPLGIGVDLGVAVEQEEGGYLLPILVRVPLEKLALLPKNETLEGGVTTMWMVADDGGGQSRIFEEVLPVAIPESAWEEARSQDAGVQLRLRLSPRVNRAAIAVRDDVAGTTMAVGFALNFGGGTPPPAGDSR